MTNRKATVTEAHGDATVNSQENFNAIYTAHQVHTIANLIFRQMAGGWNTQTPWAQSMGANTPQSFMNSGFGMAQGAAPQGFVNPAFGMTPGAAGMPMQHTVPAGFAGPQGPLAPPALFYWYP